MVLFFFFNDTATPEIYPLSLPDALPICRSRTSRSPPHSKWPGAPTRPSRHITRPAAGPDRKSTRLNSSHLVISYAVFCLKKKTDTPNTCYSLCACHPPRQHGVHTRDTER